MPEDVEEAVKVLEKKPEIKEPWGLAVWMKKKGYKMPKKKTAAEKYKLPTPQEEKEFDQYEKKILDKAKGLGEKAEEAIPRGFTYIKKPDAKKVPEKEDRLAPVFRDHKKTDTPILLEKAEEEVTPTGYGTGKDVPRVMTPKEQMEHAYIPKGEKPTFIDTVPSGKGKSLEEWASEKKEIPDIKKLHKDYIQSSESLLDDWKPTATLPKIRKAPFGGSEEDMLVYPEEFKMGMKEETEHADVVGTDKEAIKKIVLAHLKEDPKYYSKIGTVMEAERKDNQHEMWQRVMKDKVSRHLKSHPVPHAGSPGFDPKRKPKNMQAEEDKQYGDLRPKKKLIDSKIHPLVKSESDVRLPTTQVRKAEEEEKGLLDKIKNGIKDLTRSPKVKPYEKPSPLTKKVVRRLYQRSHGASAEEEFDPTKGGGIPAPVKAEEEDTERERDYTTWQREKQEEKSKPLLQRVGEKLFGEKAEESIEWPAAPKEKTSEDKIKEFKQKSPEQQDVQLRKEHPIPKDIPFPRKAEEDQTSDYLESLKTKKMPIGWKKPKGPKPETEADLPSERLSAKLIQKAEEELDMPQKEFDEDALNELYCFLRWVSDKGFKAEDGDKFEELMDRYEVEKFAEEAMPPAQFKAPEGKKVDEKCPN